jgi:hypothetical protein
MLRVIQFLEILSPEILSPVTALQEFLMGAVTERGFLGLFTGAERDLFLLRQGELHRGKASYAV